MAKTPIDRVIKPVSKFIHQEYTSGIVLFLCVIAALIWVNSPFAESYHHVWETSLSVGFAGSTFDHPLHIWINDGLMAVFFFVIGLELKREFMAGELSSVKKASLPMVAALGGMLVPAFIYFLFNKGLDSASGWGIPMATDIAFALGLLSLSGKNIPTSVKVFLSALAVADDLGAVLVIAFFYTAHIEYSYLLFGAGFLILLVGGNLLGIRHTLFYLLIGIAVWACFLFSGVHATIAGVLVAFTIPARTKINEKEYLQEIHANAKEFEVAIPLHGPLMTSDQHHIIEEIKRVSIDAQTPLQKIEYGLHPWVAFLIMPLFAIANSGMHIGSDFFSALINPVSAGVMVGLVVGKLVGVFGFTWVMVKIGIADLPRLVSWKHIFGVALLAGVGFTMSLFVTNLAFVDAQHIDAAKYGILLASLVSGAAGIVYLRSISRT
ncbi:Na+/H+ antiporter NhaA [Dyadobacter psychrophilus]|uniref:Na(+)/H(+) antiporter NhaA n=1 Tax=Dyadobacter psychrophilus TaxID=651661 RepID=A0A1T5BUD4_9BACT|nr:Na+/H+ antiporter NhaA [Dyadobacter psychrophilus]SKB50573.1 Na+:H+ antiporter, NhaA family [Dyadobacter psychrophilus]